MRRDVLWIAAVLIILGAVLMILSTVMMLNASSMLAETQSTYDIDDAYNTALRGSLIGTVGTVVAFIGIGVGFAGMAIEERGRSVRTLYQQTDRDRYAEERPPYQQQPVLSACPNCGSSMTWISDKQANYCFECKEFA
jgi:hypothetical protein